MSCLVAIGIIFACWAVCGILIFHPPQVGRRWRQLRRCLRAVTERAWLEVWR